MKGQNKLTTVKVNEDKFELFRIEALKEKYSFTKLTNSAIDLYLKDDEFRKKIKENKF